MIYHCILKYIPRPTKIMKNHNHKTQVINFTYHSNIARPTQRMHCSCHLCYLRMTLDLHCIKHDYIFLDKGDLYLMFNACTIDRSRKTDFWHDFINGYPWLNVLWLYIHSKTSNNQSTEVLTAVDFIDYYIYFKIIDMLIC